MDILLQHGWGFDKSFWKPWLPHLLEMRHSFSDRGYFNKETPCAFHGNGFPKILMTHSLGLHLVPSDLFKEVDLLVVLSGFISFHGPEMKTSKAKISAIQKALSADPKAVLTKFYQNCTKDLEFSLPSSIDVPLLKKDLTFLDVHVLDVEHLKMIDKVLIFHGISDQIVPYQKAKELNGKLNNSSLFLIDAEHVFTQGQIETVMKPLEWTIAEMQMPFKKKVMANFSLHAQDYASRACLQKKAAYSLCEEINKKRSEQIEGPILEIGCGTGHVTKGLVEQFPNSDLIISDISCAMIEECQKQFINFSNVCFKTQDGEEVKEKEHFAMIASGMAFQWFEKPKATLGNLKSSLKKGGFLFFSFLEEKSFQEWKRVCLDCRLPFTGHPLLKEEEMLSWIKELDPNASLVMEEFCLDYQTPLAFFKQLKNIGAGATKSSVSLSPSEWKKLLRHWGSSKITITYRVGFVCLKNQ